MKKCSRYAVSCILLLFFLLTCNPIYAYENTKLEDSKYVYDNGKELKEETQEELENTLKDFFAQTNIRAIIVTACGDDSKSSSEIIEEAMEEYGNDDFVVLLFSKNRRLLSCSYQKINISPYIKRILSVNENKYDNFIKDSVVSILKQIAESEHKKFNVKKDRVTLQELLSNEEVKSMLDFVISFGSIFVIIFIIINIEVYIIRLCIEELINTFRS